jgi:Dolichyl-phosphate-mannose-protein mannosyltransferase
MTAESQAFTAGPYQLESPRSTAVSSARPRTSALSTLLVGLAAVALLAAVTVPFMSRYGWDRDELYFLSAAHHLAFGYVDFPPLIAVIGWMVDQLAPHSLIALRAVSLMSGAATVILVAFTVRELGGGRRAQWIGALGWALTPYILGSAGIFHPTWLDAFAWTAFLYVATRLFVRREPRLWLLLGLIAGVGLEAKYTIAFLIAAFVVALVLTGEHRRLAGPWPWLGVAVAATLLAPNIIWQVQHGWPSLQFSSSQNAQTAADTSRGAYLTEQLLFLGSATALLVAGVAWLWRRGLRTLALVPVLVTLAFLLERGRGYYPLPADSVAVSAGAIAADQWLRGRGRYGLLAAAVAIQAAVIALAGPIVVPFYSTHQLVSSGVWKIGYFKDEIGWPELTAQVERAWSKLPAAERADAMILASNYGEASALQLYGRGLPPILSGHLSWQYWHPRRLPERYVLTVGYAGPALQRLCRTWTPVAQIDNRWHLDNQERGRLIASCTLRRPLGSDWNSLIATDRL